MVINGPIRYNQQEPPMDYPYLCFTANESNTTISMVSYGTYDTLPQLEFSFDGINWNNFIIDSTIVTLQNPGQKAYFRGNNESLGYGTGQSATCYVYFTMTGSAAVSGNVMSLLDKSCQLTEITVEHAFDSLFKRCPITTAPELPATTLTDGCYKSMFSYCDKLINVPELPATTLPAYCYSNMFLNCTSITVVPPQMATNVATAAYYMMFQGCTALTEVQDVAFGQPGLSSSMFRNCSALSRIKVSFTT